MDGPGIAAVSIGAIFIWGGIKGYSPLKAAENVITGKNPNENQAYNQLTSASSGNSSPQTNGSVITSGSGNSASNQALGKLLATQYGWATGQNWQALNYGWGTLEDNWDANATNPSSGAYGIAQALGHGTADTKGSVTNEYGPISGMSFPNSLYVAANSGSADAQIQWGLKYISLTYGQPANVPGWLGQSGYHGY